jgi:hypothetical protein
VASRHDDKSVVTVDPDESPFERPPIEGLPFDDDSEEAQAIERVMREAEREREASAKTA